MARAISLIRLTGAPASRIGVLASVDVASPSRLLSRAIASCTATLVAAELGGR